MDFKFGKSSGDAQPEAEAAPGEAKKQRALLVLLLILIGGFSYIYFFTGLIKPQEEKKAAEAPAPAAPQVVKMPLPSRDGEPAAPAGKAPEKAEAPKAAAAPAKPAPAQTAAVAKPAPAPAKPAPAPAAAKPKEAPKKAEAAKPAEKKPQAAATDKKSVAKAEETKAAPVKKGAAKDAAKKPAVSEKTPEPAAKSKHAGPESWSVIVGNYVLEEALSADMGRVRKAGLTPVVKPSSRKKSSMNRLLVAEASDRATAQSTLEKLKRHTSDAFVIEQGGKFTVYAGSYLQNEAASSEKERLKAAGFAVTVKHAEIAIPSQSLSVGPFKTKKAAEGALVKLKSTGIKATLTSK